MTAFETKVYPRRKQWWPLLLGAVALAFLVWLMVGMGRIGAYIYFPLMALVVFAMSGKALLNGAKTNELKPLRVDDTGLWIDGILRLPRRQILGGAHLRPRRSGELTLRIPSTLPLRSIEVDVVNQAEGLAVLHALGQDPAHALVRFRLASGFENPTLRKIATICLASIGAMTWVGTAHGPILGTFAALWLTAFAVSGASFLLPTYVTVGADGVFVKKGGRKRFVPFSNIAAIKNHPQYSDAIVLALTNGENVTLRTSVQDRKNNDLMISDDTRALRTRLESSLKSFRESTKEANALLQLQRGGRSAKEWIESLEGLRQERGYREVRVSDEELWRVLEDPAASAEDRAAALVALRRSLDEEGRERQRVALEACAEPRLRVVYEAATKEDETELEAALEQLHETA